MIEGFITGAALFFIIAVVGVILRIIFNAYDYTKKTISKNLNFDSKISKQDEELIFSIIANEIKTKNTKDSLYTKAYMIAKADKKQAEVEYIKLRKTQLIEELRDERNRLALEEQERKRQEKLERLRRSRQKTNIILLIFISTVFIIFFSIIN
jgi:hypothetical protein